MKGDSNLLFTASEWWDDNTISSSRWLKHQAYLDLFTNVNTPFQLIGKSVEGREIREYYTGKGSRCLIAWSQMHGNEATATYALHDLLLFIEQNSHLPEIAHLFDRIHLRIIPMVNPDGAEKWSRRTALNIDPNRDALELQSTETRILMDRIKSSGAEVAFNLHDQRNLFHLIDESDSATISFLAPSVDINRSINPTRRKAMNWVSHLQKTLKSIHSCGAAKYTDEYYPTAFGENVQALGIPTILIESGASKNDPNRDLARKLNFLLLLESLKVLSNDTLLDNYTIADYDSIPLNGTNQWDVLVKNVQVLHKSNPAQVDLGIRYVYKPDYSTGELDVVGVIGDIGDLSHHCGLKELDAKNALFENGTKLPQLEETASFKLHSPEGLIILENGFILP